jgi:polyisoprenoid-binding protein YceI
MIRFAVTRGERLAVNGGNRDITLDAGNTSVTFAVRWLGALTVRGRFAGIAGALRIPDGCVERATLSLDVQAPSVRTGLSLRDRHLRGPEFLDAARFPTIAFRSTSVERPDGVLIVRGVLTLRGQEREISATCPADLPGAGGGHPLVRLRGSFRVPRRAHQIGVAHGLEKLNPLLYAIGDEVSLTADVLVPATALFPAAVPALGR